MRRSTFYEAVGCDKCSGGWKGRAAIHEALYFTREIQQIVVSSGQEIDENAIRSQATKDGMWTLRRSGMERMMQGVTTLEEIIATKPTAAHDDEWATSFNTGDVFTKLVYAGT